MSSLGLDDAAFANIMESFSSIYYDASSIKTLEFDISNNSISDLSPFLSI